jgi:hypothetical protein
MQLERMQDWQQHGGKPDDRCYIHWIYWRFAVHSPLIPLYLCMILHILNGRKSLDPSGDFRHRLASDELPAACTLTAMPSICLTCSAEIRQPPSEKAIQPFETPCCQRPICASCLSARPSLRQYCVFCSRPADVMSSKPAAPPEVQFVIDSDEDEELPSYEALPATRDAHPVPEKKGDAQMHCALNE